MQSPSLRQPSLQVPLNRSQYLPAEHWSSRVQLEVPVGKQAGGV
jgi:hypothetical protein